MSPPIPFAPQTWLILPPSRCPQEIRNIFGMIPYGVGPALTWLRTCAPTYLNPFPASRFQFPTKPKRPLGNFQQAFMSAIRLNQMVRWPLKRLVTKWLARRLRPANTEDLFTMEAPKEPVVITDWRARTTYTFEAKTLLKDIRAKLLLSDQLFPIPQAPRNPYTNKTFTVGQLVATFAALRRTGYTDWTIESFVECGFDLAKYKTRFQYYLKLKALEATFARPTEDDCVDLLYDFIHEQYEHAEVTMPRTDVWLWFMRNRPDYPRIRCWRQWCYAYFKAQIEQPPNLETIVLPGIYREVDALVEAPVHSMIMEWKYRTVR